MKRAIQWLNSLPPFGLAAVLIVLTAFAVAAISTIIFRPDLAGGIAISLAAALVLILAVRHRAISKARKIAIRKSHDERIRQVQMEAERQRREAEEKHQQLRRQVFAEIEAGQIVPFANPGDLILRNSEALWWSMPAAVLNRQSESVRGTVYVTSLRVVFISADQPFEISVGAINAVVRREAAVELVSSSVGRTESVLSTDPEILAAFITRSVKVFHRQVDVGFEQKERGRIPQDVKHAVFLRDKGLCIECGARDYLEFDHVIPRSKGGADTVDNLQLLCRRCNLKKSDRV